MTHSHGVISSLSCCQAFLEILRPSAAVASARSLLATLFAFFGQPDRSRFSPPDWNKTSELNYKRCCMRTSRRKLQVSRYHYASPNLLLNMNLIKKEGCSAVSWLENRRPAKSSNTSLTVSLENILKPCEF